MQDISARVLPFVSPAKWEALPLARSTVIQYDEREHERRLHRPEDFVVTDEAPADPRPWTRKIAAACGLGLRIEGREAVDADFEALGRCIDDALERRLLLASLSPLVAIELASGNVVMDLGPPKHIPGPRFALLVIVFVDRSIEECNALLGKPAVFEAQALPDWVRT